MVSHIPPNHSTSSSSTSSYFPLSLSQSHAPSYDDDDFLVDSIHAAFHDTTSPLSASPSTVDSDMVQATFAKDKLPSLDIVVANDRLLLKGTGVDVEPALLSGHVVLTLSEPTSLKAINLVFKGKARLPSNPNDPHVLANSPSNYVVCTHDWSFLEGAKRHSHTLKAGRHVFPFELRVGGSLPSSLTTFVNGGATLFYKLRATAVRPGFATNLTASLPITVLRTFAPESLEYQQTLEIENTWPDKLMYALMVPHKAWAAGDELSALVKFAPISKGVRILSIVTNICETTKTIARGGHLEKTRNVVTKKHEIVRGRAVSVDDAQRRRLQRALQSSLPDSSYGRHQAMLSHPFPPTNATTLPHSGSSSPGQAESSSGFVSGISTPFVEGHGVPISDSDSSSRPSSDEDDEGEPESEISTTISIKLPPTLTPSHPLDPIIVSYRVRWSILLGNLDGHTSELRCSLPIHILDYSLLEDSRRATLATRRLLFGGPEESAEEEVQLPSYPSHVRDRVAVPGLDGIVSIPATTSAPDVQLLHQFAPEPYESGASTPLEHGIATGLGLAMGVSASVGAAQSDVTGFAPSSLGSTPPDSSHSNTPFNFGRRHHHDSSAASSLSSGHGHFGHHVNGGAFAGSPPDENTLSVATTSTTSTGNGNSRPASRHDRERSWFGHLSSRTASRTNSRVNSRATSPDRNGDRALNLTTVSTRSSDGSGHHGHHGRASSVPSTSASTSSNSRLDETHTHVNNPTTRKETHGLLSAVMKPFRHSSSHSQSSSQQQQQSHTHGSTASRDLLRSQTTPSIPIIHHHPSASASLGVEGGDGDSEFSPMSMYNSVPDYATASQDSSANTVPPLDSFRGLPTYEDSEAQVQTYHRLQQLASHEASSSNDNQPHSSTAAPSTSVSSSPEGESESAVDRERSSAANRSFGDSDLVDPFARGRADTVTQRALTAES